MIVLCFFFHLSESQRSPDFRIFRYPPISTILPTPAPAFKARPPAGGRRGGLLRRLDGLRGLREPSERRHRAATGGVRGGSGAGGASGMAVQSGQGGTRCDDVMFS